MGKRLILGIAVVAVLAFGATASHAALQNAVSVKVNFKKAGGPGSLSVQLINMDDVPLPEGKPLSKASVNSRLYDGGLVPQRISRLIVQSSSAAYNRKALPYCKVIYNGQNKIPTRADGITGAEELTYVPGEKNSSSVTKACPKTSVLGKGNFTAVVGTPGQPYDPSQAGALAGTLTAYNYQPRSGDTMGSVVRLHVDSPVPANQYLYVGVSKSGILRADVPKRSEIPTNLDATIPAGEVSMTSLDLKLTAPKPKRGKPIFTIKSFKSLNVYGQLVRE